MPKFAHMDKPLLTTAEVAERLGVDVRTVHRMVAAGRLAPVQKLAGRTGAYVFSADAIEGVEAERQAS